MANKYTDNQESKEKVKHVKNRSKYKESKPYICQAERMKTEAKRTLPRNDKNPILLAMDSLALQAERRKIE